MTHYYDGAPQTDPSAESLNELSGADTTLVRVAKQLLNTHGIDSTDQAESMAHGHYMGTSTVVVDGHEGTHYAIKAIVTSGLTIDWLNQQGHTSGRITYFLNDSGDADRRLDMESTEPVSNADENMWMRQGGAFGVATTRTVFSPEQIAEMAEDLATAKVNTSLMNKVVHEAASGKRSLGRFKALVHTLLQSVIR